MKYHPDTMERFVFEHQSIRGEIVHLDRSFATIVQQHAYPKTIQKLLGETLLATVLLAETIKIPGQLTIQFQSDSGPVKMLVAKCNHLRHIRALAQWDEAAIHAQEIITLGEGRLVVTIEREDTVEPYQSIVALNNLTIMQALEHYFAQSEQLPTKLWSFLEAGRAAGLLLQMLPSENIQDRENFWKEAEHVQKMLTSELLFTTDNESLIKNIFPHVDIRIAGLETIQFRCTCSPERMERAIKVLGPSEVREILESKPVVVVTCQYCNNEYSYTRSDIEKIFAEKS